MNNLAGLSPASLRKAADIQERILKLQAELEAILGQSAAGQSSAPASGPKPKAGRKQVVRTAKAAASENSPKRKRRLSPAARARLAAIATERWKKVKAAGKSRL
jgi:hypothetical protein